MTIITMLLLVGGAGSIHGNGRVQVSDSSEAANTEILEEPEGSVSQPLQVGNRPMTVPEHDIHYLEIVTPDIEAARDFYSGALAGASKTSARAGQRLRRHLAQRLPVRHQSTDA